MCPSINCLLLIQLKLTVNDNRSDFFIKCTFQKVEIVYYINKGHIKNIDMHS